LSRLDRCHSIADLRRIARRRLPRGVFDYIDGGADDEVSLANNSAAFAHLQLVPQVLTDVAEVDSSTEVMGRRIDMPLVLAPTGLSRLFHHLGERAVARAAARAGTVYSLSSASTVSIEDIGALTDGPKWFQIYVWRDRALLSDFMARCRAAGFDALCLTVDVQVAGNRERDLRNGMALPPRLTARLALDVLRHPLWWANLLARPPLTLANVATSMQVEGTGLTTMVDYVNAQFDRSVTWDDARWMIDQWGGPFAIKGILDPADAQRAVAAGATGIIVSNHGGRQLEHAPAPIEVLPEIAAAVAGRADVILDGGVRRGTDVLKAVALGAKACMAGRPYLYGLAAGGEAGVDRALGLLKDEIRRDMALLGVRDLGQLGPARIRARPEALSHPPARAQAAPPPRLDVVKSG